MSWSAGQAASEDAGARAAGKSALVHVDGERARVGMLMAALLAAAAGAMLQLASGRPWLHWVVTALITVTAIGCGAVAMRASRGAIDARLVHGLGVLLGVTTLCGLAYVGVFSGGVVMLCVIVFAYGLGPYHPGRITVFLTCSLGYLLLATLALTDVLPSQEAPFGLRSDDVAQLMGFTVMFELVIGLTFWMARRSRQATELALGRASEARRELIRQEALLAEAHADLDQGAVAGREGRMTGRRVGRYRVGEVIGRGAMGEIYFSWDLDRQRPAALKILHESLRDDTALVDRFFREVSVLRELRSPHVVEVLSNGLTEDGRPFLAMELLRGHDLARHLRERNRLSLDETVELISQIAFGLQAAHEAGVVHRDIKPKNIFLAETPTGTVWKVLDFGVSKSLWRSGTLTRGGVVGTPNYMSPEQARAETVDERADVFALGAIAYRALTGQPAFSGPDACAMMYQVCNRQPDRPGSFLDLPEDVELALALALTTDKNQRFGSVTRFALALHSARSGCLPHALRDAARRVLRAEPWGSDGMGAGLEPTLKLRRAPLLDALRATLPLQSDISEPVERVSGPRVIGAFGDESSDDSAA